MQSRSGVRRREMIVGGALLAACGGAQKKEGGDDDGGVTANEDLMREHSGLRRILFIYQAAAPKGDDASVLACAKLVRRFVEDYHEHTEETYIFPRLETGTLQPLVATLRLQHQAGRRLTDQLLANPKDTKAIEEFIRMYQPHAAFEDTLVFPAWKKAVGKKAYAELGEQFEAEETKMLGKQGFEHVLAEIAQIEKNLGIADIGIYTP
ncbi:MAG: hemerythrin domain-containing protein [Deltaproteobacteria bacterium]|nr:hemerythrin domain-containing protein [Deltaproteobacteria bacterium]